MLVCKVVVDVKNNNVNKYFDYLIPQHLVDVIDIGHRVYVSFGGRKVIGYVFDIVQEKSSLYELKEIIDVLDINPIITKELVDICKFMVSHYFTLYVNVVELMIPNALKVKYEKKIVIQNYDLLPDNLKLNLQSKKEVPLLKFKNQLSLIKQATANKSITIENIIKQKISKKYIKMIKLINKEPKLISQKQKTLFNYLKEISEDIPKDILIKEGLFTQGVIDGLLKNKVIDIYEKETYRQIGLNKKTNIKNITLNEEQQYIFEKIKKELFTNKTYLVHGVTGSGKTEVYLRLIEQSLLEGKESIMLVPEISLTPQMVNLAKAKFKEEVAILHSRLSKNERYDEWRKVYNKEVKIVIGARSAIFAPFTNIGLIVIDEMHEPSYKQETDPRYDTLKIAKLRSNNHNCQLILGSATPSIEYYHKALNKEITLLNINNKANQKPQPKTYIIDMKEEIKKGNKSIFSKDLYKAIKETYLKKEQTILFLNKRGHSTYVMCRECGISIDCPSCDVSLTFHKENNRLKCHYCDYEQDNVNVCPTCSSKYIKFVGSGTQKIEEEINKILPEARVLRMDTDTTTKKNATEIMFSKFKNNEADILIGTQMIAKGLDFPLVTLVGIVNADIGLKYPMYDSNERTFNIICQAAGRAGRDKLSGYVYIQTYDPDHYVIKLASNYDYLNFYKCEIEYRKKTMTPPFSKVIEIEISSEDELLCKKETNIISYMLNKIDNIIILGPKKHSIYRLNNNYRYLITLKFMKEDLSILETINQIYINKKNIKVKIVRM